MNVSPNPRPVSGRAARVRLDPGAPRVNADPLAAMFQRFNPRRPPRDPRELVAVHRDRIDHDTDDERDELLVRLLVVCWPTLTTQKG